MRSFLKTGDADMTRGNIVKQLLTFAVPMMLGLLFQQFYNTVDTVVVGRFVGKEALAAVGSTGTITNMLVGLSNGLFVGAGVVISQAYGAHDEKRLSRAVHTTASLCLILCVISTVIGLLIVKPMLIMMDTPADVFASAAEYLRIYFYGMTGLMLYNMGAAVLRAVGDSMRPLYILCFSAVINIAGDLLFVVSFGMGVAGVAYATILAEFLSALLVLFLLMRDKNAYGLRWKALCIDKALMKETLRIGLPSGFQQALTSFSNVFVQSYINYFGSACMAGYATYNKIDSFILVPVQSLSMASTTFVGQNYGANNFERARKGVRQSLMLSIIIAVACSAAVMLLARPVLRLFTTEEDVIFYGQKFILHVSPFYFLICFNQVYAGALRGIGQARGPMYIMLFSFVLFRQCYLFVVKLLGNSFFFVSIAYPMGWVVCSSLLFITYHRSRLMKNNLDTVQI